MYQTSWYGFQGEEKDDEIKGSGNSVSFKCRIHDPRLGRFLSLDPLADRFPWNSPYSFAMNRVIDKRELEGAEITEPAYKTNAGGYVIAIDGVGYQAITSDQVDNTINSMDYTPPISLPKEGVFRSSGLTGKSSYQMFKWQVDEGIINKTAPVDITKKLIRGEEVSASEWVVEALGIIPITKIGGTALKSVLKVGAKRVDNIHDFYKAANKLDVGERVALYRKTAKDFASNNNWRLNKNLMKKNGGRTIYTDPKTGMNYSLDTQHGRFEVLNKKGKHQGEIDFSGKRTKGADKSGEHDINVK